NGSENWNQANPHAMAMIRPIMLLRRLYGDGSRAVSRHRLAVRIVCIRGDRLCFAVSRSAFLRQRRHVHRAVLRAMRRPAFLDPSRGNAHRVTATRAETFGL